jgi:hypothetical protein
MLRWFGFALTPFMLSVWRKQDRGNALVDICKGMSGDEISKCNAGSF